MKKSQLRNIIRESIKELMANELLEKNIADPCLCKKDSDCKGAKEAGCYGETCFNGKCSHVEKGNYKMKQPLNERIYCTNPPAGSGCGGGKIWCEVAQDSGYGEGCFCRNPRWCDQNGTNPVCSDGRVATNGSCAGGGGRPGRGNTLEPTRRRGMNEAEEAPCYECMYLAIDDENGRYTCQKQQRDANGRCPGGYSSLRKCQRRCEPKFGDRMTGINPTKDR